MEGSTMIVVILLAVIQIILILSVVHISGKTDEIASLLSQLNENMKNDKSQK